MQLSLFSVGGWGGVERFSVVCFLEYMEIRE